MLSGRSGRTLRGVCLRIHCGGRKTVAGRPMQGPDAMYSLRPIYDQLAILSAHRIPWKALKVPAWVPP